MSEPDALAVGLMIVCRECGTLTAGEEAGNRVRWVTCQKCHAALPYGPRRAAPREPSGEVSSLRAILLRGSFLGPERFETPLDDYGRRVLRAAIAEVEGVTVQGLVAGPSPAVGPVSRDQERLRSWETELQRALRLESEGRNPRFDSAMCQATIEAIKRDLSAPTGETP